jgi:hypothetical protein
LCKLLTKRVKNEIWDKVDTNKVVLELFIQIARKVFVPLKYLQEMLHFRKMKEKNGFDLCHANKEGNKNHLSSKKDQNKTTNNFIDS